MQRRRLLVSNNPWPTFRWWATGSLVATLILAACTSGGELREPFGPESEVRIGFFDFSATSDGSTGPSVCATRQGVRLESVEILESEGAIELIGAVEISGDIHEGDFLGAVYGFPPDDWADSDPLGSSDVPQCDETDPDSVMQVILGVRRTQPTGGELRGVIVTYRSGDRRGKLEIPGFSVVVCGDQGQYCDHLSSP